MLLNCPINIYLQQVDDLVCSYIPMPENTLCIAANRETNHSRELLLHIFHPTLVMTLCLRYTAGHFMPPALHICVHSASSLWHAPTIMQCIPVGIEIHHYYSPSPVGLDINMHKRAQKNNLYGQLIKLKTLKNGQD